MREMGVAGRDQSARLGIFETVIHTFSACADQLQPCLIRDFIQETWLGISSF